MRLAAAAPITILSCLLALPVSALGAVHVSFSHPERYRDAGRYAYEATDDRVLSRIQRHLEALGERKLAPGQTLSVEVLDIDLAGRSEPWRFPSNNVRVMLDVTWPRMSVRYVLEEQGQTIASGQESIVDMNYLGQPSVYPYGDPLRYEKHMLDDWFESRFVGRRPAR
jgi:Protein of unknown function (DUF3016)